MHIIVRAAALVAVVSAVAVPNAGHARGFDSHCEIALADAIESAGVATSDIENTSVSAWTTGDDNSVVISYNAWVNLKSCAGSLNVMLHPGCWVEQVYTRGECRLPGVPHY